MSTTTLTDLNYDCLLLIAEELVNFEAIDSDFVAACKDIVSLGSTCSSLRNVIYSDVETFGGFRKDVFENVELKSNSKEKIGSLFTFLNNIYTVVETLSLPLMRLSCVALKPNENKALKGAGSRVPSMSQRMDSLCEICPILPNLHSFEIGELRTDVFGPRMPNLTRLTASKVTDERSCLNISRSWPALRELRISQYVGPSQDLKTFLIGQNHLVAFELEETRRPYCNVVRAWLGAAGAANRLTTLSLLAEGLKNSTFITRIGRCRNLERLEVNCGGLTDAVLASLGQLGSLRHLRLTKTYAMSGAELIELFRNATFSLRWVELSLFFLDRDLIARALISHNPGLEELHLSGRTSDRAFKRINSLHRLSVFACYGDRLGRNFLDRLDPSALSDLQYVVARDSNFDEESVRRFKAQFPSCQLQC